MSNSRGKMKRKNKKKNIAYSNSKTFKCRMLNKATLFLFKLEISQVMQERTRDIRNLPVMKVCLTLT